jgi:hypothetical protein
MLVYIVGQRKPTGETRLACGPVIAEVFSELAACASGELRKIVLLWVHGDVE